jgi:serine/threonine-protein kinase ATR
MLLHMDDDVGVLLDTTFFIISHYWPTFNEATQQMAEALLAFLLKNHPAILESKVDQLPSLGHLDRLAALDAELDKLRKPLDNRDALGIFALRLSHEHSGVVLQALRELSSYLKTNQDYLQASALSAQPDTVVADLLRALLDCAAKYNGVQVDIACLTAECLGLVGCIDSNRIESVREHRSFVAHSNFAETEETTDFVLFVLEEVLVKSFLSVADTKLQGFLSYAMQELLERCDVKAACVMEDSGMREGKEIYRKWLGLSDVAREVLTPFLSSRFSIAPMPPIVVDYPIFHPGKPYGNWLRSIVLELLHKGQTVLAQMVFEPLCRVIRVKDLSIAEFLLPYLFVHFIAVKGSETQQQALVEELINILDYQPSDNASFAEREDVKRYYGVRDCSKPVLWRMSLT